MNCLLLLTVVALSGIAQAQPGGRDNTIQECFSKVADVFFILDSSSSIYIEDYKQVLEFFSKTVTRFDISSEDTRIGALTFSDDYQVGFNLEQFRTKGEVLASIDERTLPYKTGITNTDMAIRFVRENVQFRDDITKVMVVITDGGSRQPGATQREADLARAAGFHMVVVGVGQYLDEQEWRNIASDPDNDYLFNITNFNYLRSLHDSLPRRICLMPPIIIGGDCGVNENADLLFLAAPEGFNDAKKIMNEMSKHFRSRDRLQVRYVMEACEDFVDRGFQGPGTYCNRFDETPEDAENVFPNLMSRLRSLATAMRAERVANQVVVLFVDNQSMVDSRYEILNEVRNAGQFDGLEIIVVDLGVRDYSNFVNGMTQNPENIITTTEQEMFQTVQQVVDRICVAANDNPFVDTRVS